MIGSAILLSNFIEGNMKQFIIPVYQRNYDWLIDNCEQLFNDLVKLSKQHKQTHFFGSIVTASADAYGRNRLVIDGQQRITTISLLLLAGIKAVKDGKLLVSNEARLNEAYEMFLLAKFSSADRKIKLVPIESDRIAYDLIFDNAEDKFIAESKVTRNFMYFYGLLTNTLQEFSFDDLLNAIERLQIDKIRNYLLMSLSPEEQQQCFKDYWQKIEQATDNEPTMFLRDYLTIRQQRQRHVRLPYMYQEWKKYMEVKDRKEELAQMLDYAKYYRQITKSQLSTPRLSKKMSHICNIDTDVVNVFFMQFLKHADENGLQEDEVYEAIDLIENYMARRIVCNMPGNALTQVFCALYKDVLRSIDEYRTADVPLSASYSDILAYHILRRDGNYLLPRDAQFIEAIKTRDAYHMMKPFQIFLFERLENAVPGEYNDVASDMKNKTATLEHIMPQTLNADWKAMLGNNYEEIKEKYLHTFANLTLTGINSELSNNSFDVKRDGKVIDGESFPGYKD